MFLLRYFFFAYVVLALIAAVSGHAFIRHWKSSLDDQFRRAQKTPLLRTSYRDAPDNIGWIGSKFLNYNHAIVCGASYTPRNTVAPPGGKIFADASQAAGQTLAVNAGGKITLIVSSDHGKGYPHARGHIQTYLGYCGPSPTACQTFNAADAYFFKIQEVVNGVRRLRQRMSYGMDGDVWTVPIPYDTPQGSYIFRFEIVTSGESLPVEGLQDQYYPSCGQIYVLSSDHYASFSSLPLVHFPGGYPNGNLKPMSVPGPPVAHLGRRRARSGRGHNKRIDKPEVANTEVLPLPIRPFRLPDPILPCELTHQERQPLCMPQEVPLCGKVCFKKKVSEMSCLAPDCVSVNAACLCSSSSFVEAFNDCVDDHCSSEARRVASKNALKKRCDPVS